MYIKKPQKSAYLNLKINLLSVKKNILVFLFKTGLVHMSLNSYLNNQKMSSSINLSHLKFEPWHSSDLDHFLKVTYGGAKTLQ